MHRRYPFTNALIGAILLLLVWLLMHLLGIK